MEIALWLVIFVLSLVLLVKGADWMLESAERIGLALGLSSFIIGVTIVGLGTSFPELVAALVAMTQGVTEIVTANAIGSNIANILLVIGVSALVGKKLVVSKDLIDLDLPLLVVATLLFAFTALDGLVTEIEAALLLLAYGIYFAYIISTREKDTRDRDLVDDEGILPDRSERRHALVKMWGSVKDRIPRPDIQGRDILMFFVGLIVLILGAKYLVDSVVALSGLLGVAIGAITLFAVAFGTSLPELFVSARAAWKNKPAVALGSIFGSNVFNLLIVIGIPGVFTSLTVDEQTLTIGLPVLLASTFLFLVSGISKRIHGWEGGMYLIFYVLFVGKLFGLF